MKWSEPVLSGGPPTIKNHSVTYHDGLLYCFGGYDGRKNHMTLLVYSIADQRWMHATTTGNTNTDDEGNSTSAVASGNNSSISNLSKSAAALGGLLGESIMVSGTPPPGRNGHTATLASDGEDDGRIIIIGGWLGSGPLAAHDMHVLDVSGGPTNLRWYQPAVKGTPPGPCNMHSADYVPARREVFVFRGGNGREYLNDLHALHVDTYEWRKVETTGEAPQQRANHSSALLEETSELFIFGGWNGKERLNDVYILNTETLSWTCPHVSGVLPHPRAGMTLTALGGRLFLFGGSGTSSKCFHDLQILDRKEMAWLDVMHSDDDQQWGNNTSNGTNNATPRNNTSSGYYDEMIHDEDYHRTSAQSGHDGGNTGSLGLQDSMDVQTSTLSTSRAGGGWMSSSAGMASPNPNDEDTIPTIFVHGQGPGRRAGHTATAVHRHIYVFGGSCGSDYLNDFFVLDTDPPPRAYVNTPTSLQLFERRLRLLYNEEEFSDVTFLVEGQKVYGHKMVLSLVSDCFRAMFTTGFRESEVGAEIEIPLCSHDAFCSMMEYIYTGQTPKCCNVKLLDTNQQAAISGIGRVVDLLELADRFFLDHLKQVCERILEPAVSAETVDYLHQVAHKTNSMQLEAVCAHFERNLDT